MGSDDIMQRVMLVIPMILSLSVHEWAHAWSAWKLGDDTASREGRLTLNPTVHIDPIGTLLLPLLGIPFGWAKPVPVNPARFRRNVHMGTGMALTAAAGPISNLILSLGCAVTLGLLFRFAPELLQSQKAVMFLLLHGIQLNIGLAIFNLIPLPPLDGSRILDRFIPYRMREGWESFSRFSPLLLLLVIATGGFFLAGPAGYLNGLMLGVFRGVAGG